MADSSGVPKETVSRVDRSFGFIDLSGFTAYTDSEGDAQANDVLHSFRSVVRTICAARGVRVEKWLGDGAMLVAVEPETLFEAIVDIEVMVRTSGSPLALRAGVNSGPVILFEGDDYVGRAVNVAARLCDLAGPNEVLAPADAVSSLLVNTVVTPVGPKPIRGLENPIEVVRLSAPDET